LLLGDFLDGGGCMLLSSPQYFEDRELTAFATNYLGVGTYSEIDEGSTPIPNVSGAGTFPGFKHLSSLSLNFGDAGLDGTTSDALTLATAADASPLLTYGAAGIAAVGRDTEVFRSAYLGFPLRALTNNRTEVLEAFLDFCVQIPRDDRYEVNDDGEPEVNNEDFQEFATGLQETVELNDLKILPGNDDFFRWSAGWSAETSFTIGFDHDAGDLTIELYDNTQLLLATSQTSTDDEEIVINVVADQRYYLRVYAEGLAGNGYALEITQSGVQDLDGDGVADNVDAFPSDPDEWADSDNDGVGDNEDGDGDNDGMSDAFETQHELNPGDPADADLDADGDGATNLEEAQSGTDPQDPESFPSLPDPEVFTFVTCFDNDICTSDSRTPDGRCVFTPLPESDQCPAATGSSILPLIILIEKAKRAEEALDASSDGAEN
jgi:hypothetical protein